MGKTFSTGLLTDGISQDSSNNIGIGGATSGTNKFEVSGSTKLNGNTAITGSLSITGSATTIGNTTISGSLTVSSSANAIILPAGQTIGLGTAQIYTGTGGNSGNIFVQGAQTKLYADKVILEAATAAGVEVIGGTKLSGSFIVSGSATTIGNTVLSGSLNVSGSITSTSTITAQTLVVQTITSSVLYSSGSNIFGNSLSNTQVFTGSVGITGSLTLNNIAIPTSASLASTYLPLTGGTLTGALSGTSAAFSGSGAFGSAAMSTARLTITDGTSIAAYWKATNTNAATRDWAIITNNANFGDFAIRQGNSQGADATSGTDRLLISATGAATFINGASKLFEIASNSASGGYTRFTYNTSTSIGYIGSSTQLSGLGLVSDLELRADNNLFFTTTGGSLKLASTGAATFSSSVSIGGYLTGTGVNPGGLGGSRYIIDWSGGYSRIFSMGVNASTNGGLIFNSQRSDGTNSIDAITIAPSGAATFRGSGDDIVIIGNGVASQNAYLQLNGGSNAYVNSIGNGKLILGANGAASNHLNITSGGVITIPNLAGVGSRTVNASATGELSAASDSRLKQEDLNHKIEGLAEILQIQPRAYKWLSDIDNRGENATTEIGFFANEIASIIPSAAPMGNDGYYGFYDRAVIAALVKAIQELKAENDTLKDILQRNNII